MTDTRGERTNTTHRGVILCGLYVFALAVRLVYLFAFVHPTPLNNDEHSFAAPASHLAAGEGYLKVPQQSEDGTPRPTAYRPPGPALILAAVFAVTGPEVLAARVACVALASLSAPLVFVLTQRIGGATTAATLGGLACAVYPSWVHFSVQVLSEAVYIPLVLALILLAETVAHGGGGWWRWPGLGVGWAAATLVRPHALPCAALIAVFLLWRQPRLVPRLILAGVCAGLVLGAWATRNAVQLGHPVLLATEGGETLLGANNPHVWFDPEQSGMWMAPVEIPEYRHRLQSVHGEVERDRVQNRMATEFVREHLTDLPTAVTCKLWRWLTPFPKSGGMNRVMVLSSYAPLLIVLGYGVISGVIRRSFLLATTIAITFASCVVTAVYWGNLTRGRLPLEILWLPWAAVSAHHAGQKLFGKKARSPEANANPLQPALTPGG